MKKTGEKVKGFRESQKMERKKFAEKMGISYSLQMQIELGFKPASKRYIEKFHEIFSEANIEDIFFN